MVLSQGDPTSARGAALARALIATRADAGPRDEIGIAGKAAHVGADLGEDLHRSKGLDARRRTHLLDGGAKGPNADLHLPVDLGNRGIEYVDLVEVKPQQEAMVPCHAATQGLVQGLS